MYPPVAELTFEEKAPLVSGSASQPFARTIHADHCNTELVSGESSYGACLSYGRSRVQNGRRCWGCQLRGANGSGLGIPWRVKGPSCLSITTARQAAVGCRGLAVRKMGPRCRSLKGMSLHGTRGRRPQVSFELSGKEPSQRCPDPLQLPELPVRSPNSAATTPVRASNSQGPHHG